MKKLLTFIFYLVMVFYTSILGQDLKIVCSTYPMYIFTQNITQNIPVQVHLLLPPDLGCPHNYSLIPKDMQKIAQADILIINGLGMEEFMDVAIKKANRRLLVIDSSTNIFPMSDLITNSPESCGHEHTESCQHSEEETSEHIHTTDCEHFHALMSGHSAINPHIFTSPKFAILQVKNIADGLAKKDSKYAQQYQVNAEEYCQKLEKLIEESQEVKKNLLNHKVVTHHNVWDYLAQDIGVEVVGVVMQSDGKEPVAAQMLKIIKQIRDSKAIAIFSEPQYSSKVPARIAKETGIILALLDPMVTGPSNPPLDYYQIIMRANFATLKKVLGHAKQ